MQEGNSCCKSAHNQWSLPSFLMSLDFSESSGFVEEHTAIAESAASGRLERPAQLDGFCVLPRISIALGTPIALGAPAAVMQEQAAVAKMTSCS